MLLLVGAEHQLIPSPAVWASSSPHFTDEQAEPKVYPASKLSSRLGHRLELSIVWLLKVEDSGGILVFLVPSEFVLYGLYMVKNRKLLDSAARMRAFKSQARVQIFSLPFAMWSLEWKGVIDFCELQVDFSICSWGRWFLLDLLWY